MLKVDKHVLKRFRYVIMMIKKVWLNTLGIQARNDLVSCSLVNVQTTNAPILRPKLAGSSSSIPRVQAALSEREYTLRLDVKDYYVVGNAMLRCLPETSNRIDYIPGKGAEVWKSLVWWLLNCNCKIHPKCCKTSLHARPRRECRQKRCIDYHAVYQQTVTLELLPVRHRSAFIIAL